MPSCPATLQASSAISVVVDAYWPFSSLCASSPPHAAKTRAIETRPLMAQDDPRVRRLRQWWQSRRARRGRILAVKLGYNPNSSSLGVDVTFLVFGMATIAILTPIIAFLLRRPRNLPDGGRSE